MSDNKYVDRVNEQMVAVSEAIDANSEAARLQGSVLAGGLLGGWIVAASVSIGYTPFATALMLTSGTAAGLTARVML
jgi:hypothetical protein